jgi:amidophosphoribosyltransferase
MLRGAGAVEVHVRISAPPVKWPCFYGIDFATRAELIANGLDTEGIRRSIGADSLGYVSLSGLIAATEQPKTRLCRACFDGEYPIGLPTDNLIGKHVLEGVGRRVSGGHTDQDPAEPGADRRNTANNAGNLPISPRSGEALRRS